MVWLLFFPGLPIGVFLLLILYTWLSPHAHRCRCGFVWRHCGLWNSAGERCPKSVRAHTCKRCGSVQWWRTDGT